MSERSGGHKNISAGQDASLLTKAVLDHLDEGILLIGPDDNIRLWNDRYLEMLDLPASLFDANIGIKPLIRALADRGDYGPGDPAVLTEQLAENVRLRQPARGERQMVNGRIIDAEWIPLADGHFLFRMRDVTSERTASRFKDELIATVSHELRTPLSVIGGALALLRANPGQANAADLVELAYRNGERLNRLVNDLLDIDKLQSEGLDFDFAPADIGALLTASVEQNRPYASGLGIDIDLEIPDEPVLADVDRDRMMQVMSNLLSNAAKFSPSGSRVRVRMQPSTAGARISVIDKGCGMSPEFRHRLFTRFAQENPGSLQGQAGTGLGLAICKSIVDRHHGQIDVDTREAVGTIFHVDLPYRQDGAAAG